MRIFVANKTKEKSQMSERYGRFQALTAESNKVKKSYEKVSKICSIYI
jgi:hypothetical protein